MDGTHLIDGAAGTPHISALDVRTHNATLFGDGVYITDGLDGLPITVTDANTLTIGRGCMLVNGARITQESLLKLTIESGQQGVNRNDLLVGTYTYDGANTRLEDVNFEIVTGTPTSGTAKDPTIHSGTLLDINGADLVDGVSTVQFPIARIPITGIAVGTPVVLAKKFTSVESLRDSVYQATNSLKTKDITVSITGLNYGTVFAKRSGNMVVIDIIGAGLKSNVSPWTWSSVIAKIPKSHAPNRQFFGAVATDQGVADLMIAENGEVSLFAKSTTIETGHNVDGQLTYIVG